MKRANQLFLVTSTCQLINTPTNGSTVVSLIIVKVGRQALWLQVQNHVIM